MRSLVPGSGRWLASTTGEGTIRWVWSFLPKVWIPGLGVQLFSYQSLIFNMGDFLELCMQPPLYVCHACIKPQTWFSTVWHKMQEIKISLDASMEDLWLSQRAIKLMVGWHKPFIHFLRLTIPWSLSLPLPPQIIFQVLQRSYKPVLPFPFHPLTGKHFSNCDAQADRSLHGCMYHQQFYCCCLLTGGSQL